MPQIKAEISIGNILSMAVSMVALLSMVVTVAVFGTQLRSDVDRHERSISDIHLQLAKQIQTNEQNIKALAEISVDLKYMREALSRLENRESRRAP
ncbi:hypothetical protein [Hyphomicrobium sp.]|uniref:hypothetical protein n=1 Tax=Hyphomicrobium sp. TaxID=82 RepID=UPI0025C72759|nr:hypothetical protein [Hyphomicrobium sp.]